MFAPALMKYTPRIGIRIFPTEVNEFFMNLTKQAIKARGAEAKEVSAVWESNNYIVSEGKSKWQMLNCSVTLEKKFFYNKPG